MLFADIIGFWDVAVFAIAIAGWVCWKLSQRAFASNPELKDKAEKTAVDTVAKAIDRFLK